MPGFRHWRLKGGESAVKPRAAHTGRDENMSKPKVFKSPHGTEIAYHKTDGGPVTVVFMGGLMSDMTGTKATFLEDFCQEKGWGYLRFDYGGHGQSSGKFEEGTIGSWLTDALAAVDHLTEGPVILAGSSLGGWMVLLTALARPDRVAGLVGMASAPDFTKRLLWPDFTPAHKKEMEETGMVKIKSEYGDEPYIFTQALMDEADDHLVLEAPIRLDMPVRLIHGMADTDVPYDTSVAIMERLECPDAALSLVKGAGHSLSEDADLDRLGKLLKEVVGAAMERIKG